MKSSVYLRPLKIEDALISYQWRNNPKIWKFTGYRPDRLITPELETEWLKSILKRQNELRFAICLQENDEYIGNVFLTDITPYHAQVHIFIGDIKQWGGGKAYEAIKLLLSHAFLEMKLDYLYNIIEKNNTSSLILSKRLGAVVSEDLGDSRVKNIFTREMFEKGMHNIYVHKTAAEASS